MERLKVIKTVNLPTKLPLTSSAVVYLLMKQTNASSFVCGIFVALWAILWIVSIVLMFCQEPIDIFED